MGTIGSLPLFIYGLLGILVLLISRKKMVSQSVCAGLGSYDLNAKIVSKRMSTFVLICICVIVILKE